MECIGRFWGPPGGVGSAPRRVRVLRPSLRRPLAPRCPDWAKSIYSLRSSLSCCAMVGIELTLHKFLHLFPGHQQLSEIRC